MSSPVTDGEQWSDELDETETETEASPQGLGYAPLDYQVLDGEQAGDGDTETADQDAASPQLPDVASAMLRAMEADYRACLQSEARLATTTASSNGPVAPTAVEATSTEASREERAGSDLEANGSVSVNSTCIPGQEQGESGGGSDGDDGDGVGGGDGGEGLATTAAPPRPISPLGQDQAERVMRAMQGFSLAPSARPRGHLTSDLTAGFEPDWGSADAVANLGATATASASSQANNRGETHSSTEGARK
eukprot:g18328.t1